MEKYLNEIKMCRLFNKMNDKEIINLLTITKSKIVSYKKEDALFSVGDYAKAIGIVVFGEIAIERVDISGNKTIISQVLISQTFLEAFVLSKVKMPISVMAHTNCVILYIEYEEILNLVNIDTKLYKIINENLLDDMSKKLIFLNQKVSILEKQTIREKILSYLDPFFIKYKNEVFTIPFNREQLASYLAVNRAALSRELSNMKKEGIIDYYKNSIKKL